MKLLYGTVQDDVKACMLAAALAGIKINLQQKEDALLTLQVDQTEEILGELSICRFLVDQCAWMKEDQLSQEEWFVYELKPALETVSKKTIKSSQEAIDMVRALEERLTRPYFGGDNPNTLDVLSIAYLHKSFAGNAWAVREFPRLADMFNKLREPWVEVNKDFGVSLAAGRTKKQDVFAPTRKLTRTLSPVAPAAGLRNILITSALPYVNNVPHLGNLIGCVLSADVYARYCRLRGHNTLYICGTDEYGTATETKAIQEGLTPQAICDKYFAIHRDVYEWFDIDFDFFGRTTTSKQTEIAQEIFLRLHTNQELFEEDVQQSFCEKCARFLADRFVHGTCPFCSFEDARGDQCDSCSKLLNPEDLVNPRCFLCATQPIMKSSRHVFINLPNIKDRLVNWIEESSQKGKWSHNCMQATQAWIRDGLKPRCITRDLKWGVSVPLPEFAEKVFYVWFDAPIGYLSITANYTDEWQKWWKNPEQVELIQFMGKDNVPFHTVVFPCSLLGTKEEYTLLQTISTTEYLNYEGGKFSKTHARGVFGDDAIKTGIPSEIFRFYLLINRPENSDTDFQWSDLQVKTNTLLMPNLGNLCNRVLKTMSSLNRELGVVTDLQDADRQVLASVFEVVGQYCQEIEELRLKSGLELAMKASAIGNKYFQDQKMWELQATAPERYQTILVVSANIVRLLGLLAEPYIPGFSAKLYAQLNLERTPREQTLLKEIVEAESPEVLLQLLSPHVVVTEALPIIKTLKDEEIRALKQRFSGR